MEVLQPIIDRSGKDGLVRLASEYFLVSLYLCLGPAKNRSVEYSIDELEKKVSFLCMLHIGIHIRVFLVLFSVHYLNSQ